MPSVSQYNEKRSPWALIIIVIVVILFGLFWLWQRTTVPQLAPTQHIAESDTTASSSSTPSFDLTTLEASAVNIPVPDFDKAF